MYIYKVEIIYTEHWFNCGPTPEVVIERAINNFLSKKGLHIKHIINIETVEYVERNVRTPHTTQDTGIRWKITVHYKTNLPK